MHFAKRWSWYFFSPEKFKCIKSNVCVSINITTKRNVKVIDLQEGKSSPWKSLWSGVIRNLCAITSCCETPTKGAPKEMGVEHRIFPFQAIYWFNIFIPSIDFNSSQEKKKRYKAIFIANTHTHTKWWIECLQWCMNPISTSHMLPTKFDVCQLYTITAIRWQKVSMSLSLSKIEHQITVCDGWRTKLNAGIRTLSTNSFQCYRLPALIEPTQHSFHICFSISNSHSPSHPTPTFNTKTTKI